MDDELFARFSGRYEVDGGGCWLWRGAVTADGCSTISKGGKTQYAHRLAYAHFIGEIPSGRVIDHLCRTRSCVNPAHLEAVSNRENVVRGVSGLGVTNRCKRGHELTQENTVYQGSSGKRRCKTCRNAYARDRARSAAATRSRAA